MSIMNKEQISILTAPFLHHTFAYGLDSIEANGFRSIDLWGASPHFCLDDDTPEGHTARIREINQMLKDRGLKMTVFHPEQCRQYPINIASPIPYVRNYSINMMKQYLEDTAAFETDKMMLHPGWEYVDSPSEDNFLRLVESVQILSEKAEELGIVMVMEEMSAADSLFARDLSHLEKLIKSVNSPWVKAGLDLIQAENNAETISDFCSRLGLPAHVHFADRKEGYAALGKGDFAFAGRLEELEQLGYKDTISLSLWGADFYKDPDEALRACADWFRFRS